jgi:hypothetical protein
MARMYVPKYRRLPLKVGQRVFVRMGGQKIRGVLVEDRGAIGKGGRRLWRVRAGHPAGAAEPAPEFEVPSEQVVPASTRRNAAPARGGATRTFAR